MQKKQPKRRLLGQRTTQLQQAEYLNHVWIYDFVFDQTSDGRMLKHLIVVDEFTKEGLMIKVARSLTSTNVVQCLDYLFDLYGTSACIKSDNGPEFVARQVQSWLKEKHVHVHYIAPGSPWQNGTNESFNGVFRDGCLNCWEFYSVAEARRVIEQWLEEYNSSAWRYQHADTTRVCSDTSTRMETGGMISSHSRLERTKIRRQVKLALDFIGLFCRMSGAFQIIYGFVC